MPTPSPSPSTVDPAHAALHGFWNGLTTVADQHRWIPVIVGLMIGIALVRSARLAIHSGPRDPVRRFTRTEKAMLLGRAGHQCEHHGWPVGRCTSTEQLEADHVHPWSRGGWTHVSNGQILCRAHNRAKSAAVPFDRSLRRISERRTTYYPQGVNGSIVRRQTARSRKASA